MANQFIGYGITGAIGTSVHYALFFVLLSLWIAPPLATSVGALVGGCVNFVLCRKFVFSSDRPEVWSQVARFSATAFLSLFVSALTVVVLAESVGVWFAQVLATAITVLLGYQLNRCWTFRSSTDTSA